MVRNFFYIFLAFAGLFEASEKKQVYFETYVDPHYEQDVPDRYLEKKRFAYNDKDLCIQLLQSEYENTKLEQGVKVEMKFTS